MNTTDETGQNLPVVEIFQSIQGEGSRAGFPSTFIRLFGCNLRCSWCDTQYSYEPSRPNFWMSIDRIIGKVREYGNYYTCLTGGEPLLHGKKSILLLKNLSQLDFLTDIHVETNGAINLGPFIEWREENEFSRRKVRFVMDYKLPSSGMTSKMVIENFSFLKAQDEIKLVIANDRDFFSAIEVLDRWYLKGLPLFSAVWESMPLERLASLVMESNIKNAKLNIQLHKVIWGAKQGV